MFSAVRRDAPEGLDSLWARAFDPDRPLETPSGLAKGFAVDPYLARAVQTMQQAGLAIDVPLGDVQYALRSRPRIGLHGGPGGDGLTNVIGYSDPSMTSEPMPDPGARIVSGSDLRDGGYPVDNGTSWLMTVDFTGDEPAAWVMLTYGETGDRSSPLFDVQTQRFSDKNWREAAFTEAAIAADPDLTEQTVTGTR
jgi:acyl-homoserine-lactone acylase